VTLQSPPEERRRLRRIAAQREAARREHERELLQERFCDVSERALLHWIAVLWEEALWLERTGQPPSGQPIDAHARWRIEAWQHILSLLAEVADAVTNDRIWRSLGGKAPGAAGVPPDAT